MEASVAQCAQITPDIVETTTPRTTRETMETLMRTDLSIRKETHSTIPRMHLVAGTTDQFR